MDADPQLLYLEPDDEITSVIRRLRGADVGRVVLVAPGRSRATSSVVALRLLARAASDSGRSVALVADASTRALAGEAGIAAFASVADATSPTPSPAEPMTPTRAPIHVVRGSGAGRGQPARPIPATDGMEETVAVHLPAPVSSGSSRRGRVRTPRLPRWPWLVGLLVVALAAGAALLPGATVRITPATFALDARPYSITVAVAGREADQLEVTIPGSATGERIELIAATGTVTFYNYNFRFIQVPAGTGLAADDINFVTTQTVVVPGSGFVGFERVPGTENAPVAALQLGPDGNVPEGAIDTITDSGIRSQLREQGSNPNRLVENAEPTSGGGELSHAVITDTDIAAVMAKIETQLAASVETRLAADPTRIYATASEPEVPDIEVPPDLVGTEDTPTFELSATLDFDRPYASRADVEATARSLLLSDDSAAPTGTTILPDSITIELGPATASAEGLQVTALVASAAAAAIDVGAVRDRVAGLTVAEARAALEDLGEIQVDLWPSWLDRLPGLAFRISVETVAPSPGPSASP